MKNIMTEDSGFEEAEKLNEELADASDALIYYLYKQLWGKDEVLS